MYAQRMMIDPQYPYPRQRFMSRPPVGHGSQHIPQYNMQVCSESLSSSISFSPLKFVNSHLEGCLKWFSFLFFYQGSHINGPHLGPRYPIGPDGQPLQPPHQQHSYPGPTHGPSLGPRPMTLQPGGFCAPPPEGNMYPSQQHPEGQSMQPMGNRYPRPGVPMHSSYPPYGPHSMNVPRMWPPMNHHGQPTPGGPMMQEQSATSQHQYNSNMIHPPHSTGYAMTNGQYRMPSISSQSPIGQRPPGAPQVTRPHLASMLDSPEMIALQQLLASSSHHVENFQPTPQSGGNVLASAALSSPENQLIGPVRDGAADIKHTPISPKGKSWHSLPYFGITLLLSINWFKHILKHCCISWQVQVQNLVINHQLEKMPSLKLIAVLIPILQKNLSNLL